MDSFFGIGVFELVFIVIFALIFLGPERLPGLLRQIIGVIRQVRDLTSDVTRQFNDEFGDIRELDPRHQIQKALNETTSEIKDATKPVSKALNKPAAKPTPNAAAKPAAKPVTPKTTPATPKSTAAAATTDVAAAAESSADSAEVVAAVSAAGAQAASADGEADGKADGGEKAVADTGSAQMSSPSSTHFADKTAKAENSDKPKLAAAVVENDLTENTIAPPSAARQAQSKDAKTQESNPADMSVDKPVVEPEAEEESA